MRLKEIRQGLKRALRKEIHQALVRALLEEGEMHRELYEYEMEEHVDYWKKSMYRDQDEFLFVVTARLNHVTNEYAAAMLLMENSGETYINEPARERLKELWGDAYSSNMKILIPDFVDQLERGELPVNGVKTEPGFRA